MYFAKFRKISTELAFFLRARLLYMNCDTPIDFVALLII